LVAPTRLVERGLRGKCWDGHFLPPLCLSKFNGHNRATSSSPGNRNSSRQSLRIVYCSYEDPRRATDTTSVPVTAALRVYCCAAISIKIVPPALHPHRGNYLSTLPKTRQHRTDRPVWTAPITRSFCTKARHSRRIHFPFSLHFSLLPENLRLITRSRFLFSEAMSLR
jgi:hypothetical protein